MEVLFNSTFLNRMCLNLLQWTFVKSSKDEITQCKMKLKIKTCQFLPAGCLLLKPISTKRIGPVFKPVNAWFLKFAFVHEIGMHVCLCVCLPMRLLITGGVI